LLQLASASATKIKRFQQVTERLLFFCRRRRRSQRGRRIEISADPHKVRVADIQLLYLHKNKDATLLDRAVQVDALPDSWRTWLIERADGTRSRSG
jgi:hypothetical protein